MARSEPQDSRWLTAKGQATRDRIVKAAAELIITDGLSAFNMDNVRKAASISGSQLGHYFADKQALTHAVIAHQIQVVLEFHRQPQLHGLESLDDFERWADLNVRYLRRIGYAGTPTYHALVGQLAKSDAATRDTLAAGYWQWVELLEHAITRMKDHGALSAEANARELALVIVAAHQGGGTLAFTYHEEWPHADAVRWAVNYLRLFATAPDERAARPAHRLRGGRSGLRAAGKATTEESRTRLTRKGLATRARITDVAAQLMFERGIAGTSIDGVRRSAAVSGSQIAHYFQNKRDLTRQVVAARWAGVKAFHTQPRLGALDSLPALQTWADACVTDIDARYRRGGCVYGSLAGELIEADEDIHRELAAGYDEWIELFRAGLTAMRLRGDLRPDADPRHLAVSLVTAHQGGALITYITGNPQPLRATINAAVEYLRSFAPAPTETP